MASRIGNIHLSVVAGILATIGSLFGKLAGGVAVETTVFILMKLTLIVLMVTSNTAGCVFFVKSFQGSVSSLPATVASAATNYFCSALVGFLIFGESTSLMWWTGTALVLSGLLLICYAPSTTVKETDKLKQG